MTRYSIPITPLLLAAACATGNEPTQDSLSEEAVALAAAHAAPDANPDDARLAAGRALEYFGAGTFVVRATVDKLHRQRLRRGDGRDLLVLTLRDVARLSGALDPGPGPLRAWSWDDAEAAFRDLRPGQEITVALLGNAGQQRSYALAHPAAVTLVEEGKMRLPFLALEPRHLGQSLDRLAGGAR